MGLAAVPFGTAQAKDFEIKVTQEYTCDPNDPKSEKDGAMHFEISVGKIGKDPHVADIVWPHDKEYPEPMGCPNGFMRRYENELRVKKEVHDALFGGAFKEVFNALEWLYYQNEKDKLIGFFIRERRFFGPNLLVIPSLKKRLMGHFHLRSEEEVERVFKLFEEGKRAIELIEEDSDRNIKRVQEMEGDKFEEIRSKFYYPRLNLPECCTCVMYRFENIDDAVIFWLMRDPYRLVGRSVYALVIYAFNKNVRVTSDIPTVCIGAPEYTHISNEILSKSFREFVISSFCIRRLSFFKMPRFFIRQGHRPDEIELNGENAAPDKCDYFVQTDPFGEKITDIWEKGKRLNMDGIKNRKFKDSKEIVKFLEEKFGKKQRNKKKFTIYHNSSMHALKACIVVFCFYLHFFSSAPINSLPIQSPLC